MRTIEIFNDICASTTTNDFWNDWQTFGCMDAPDPAYLPTGGTRKYTLKSGETVMIAWGYSGSYETYAAEKPKGGKREGSGRKALDEGGTVIATVRVTLKQKEKLERIGGAKWVRAQLDLFEE